MYSDFPRLSDNRYDNSIFDIAKFITRAHQTHLETQALSHVPLSYVQTNAQIASIVCSANLPVSCLCATE